MEETIVELEFGIEGIAPLLMDRYHDLPDPRTEEGYRKQAEAKCYRAMATNGEKGELVIEAKALKACMRLASSELGKKMEGKKNRQSIQSGVFFKSDILSEDSNPAFSIGRIEHDGLSDARPGIAIDPARCRIDHDGLKVDLITRAGVGGKVTRVKTYRPSIKEWKLEGRVSIMAIPKGFVKQALELGGVRYGLLGYRPEFGRFIVTKFEEVKQ